MTSKTFQKYLNSEDDDDILKAQYVIISMRILPGKKDKDNIINLRYLYPDFRTCAAETAEQMTHLYYEQLDENIGLIASIILSSEEEGMNVILLDTRREEKLKVLENFSNYVFDRFGYPVYSYDVLMHGGELIEYNKKKIIKKCRKILNSQDKDLYKGMSEDVKKSKFKKMKKKELQNLLDSYQIIYTDDMDKGELIDLLVAYL